jgi:hypothetical protein
VFDKYACALDGYLRRALFVWQGSTLLTTLANMFASVGMHVEASDCFVRAGNPKAAVDCCVSLNRCADGFRFICIEVTLSCRWSTAIELAEQHGFPQIEGLLTRYANQLQVSIFLYVINGLYPKLYMFI